MVYGRFLAKGATLNIVYCVWLTVTSYRLPVIGF